MPIPACITRIFREGGYIPFTFLTNDALQHAHNGNSDGIKGVQLWHGVLISASKDLSRAGGEDLQYQLWCQALERFLELIKKHIPQDYRAWIKHYNWMVDQEGFKGANFKLYDLYDISLRYAATDDATFDISQVQKVLLAKAERTFQSEAMATKARRLFAQHIPQLPSLSGPTRTNAACMPSGLAAAKPANRSKLDHNGFCFWCGRRNAHHTKVCQESTMFGGTTPLLQGHMFTSSNDEAWSNKSGKQYCYLSNTSRNCPDLPAPATLCTRAPYVALPPTLPPHAPYSNPRPTDPRIVTTPLQANAWENELRNCTLLNKFGNVVHSIRFGFNMGIKTSITST
jgi:hypothetical protein